MLRHIVLVNGLHLTMFIDVIQSLITVLLRFCTLINPEAGNVSPASPSFFGQPDGWIHLRAEEQSSFLGVLTRPPLAGTDVVGLPASDGHHCHSVNLLVTDNRVRHDPIHRVQSCYLHMCWMRAASETESDVCLRPAQRVRLPQRPHGLYGKLPSVCHGRAPLLVCIGGPQRAADIGCHLLRLEGVSGCRDLPDAKHENQSAGQRLMPHLSTHDDEEGTSLAHGKQQA
mmetsp:Transcript_59277/g.138827  ORF Transcript_59277/g.138827 Transcript_59277/m.138827 type:complete len:228 (+) Transcript_59277:622-1305(+)